MGKILLTLLLLNSLTLISQETADDSLFSKAIGENIRKYRLESRRAHRTRDKDRAQFLFDSLVNNVVNGTLLDNFNVRKFSGRKTTLHKFKKPIYLISYASWCVPNAGEIPAFNDISEKYFDEIDFVVLFWGSKRKIRKFKRKYNKRVHILYVDEKENKNDFAIRILKHSVGFPTSFFISLDKNILDVRRNHLDQYNKEYTSSYNSNYQSYMSGVSLLKKDMGNEVERNSN
ncbi:MAG: thiol-disulfide isomerase/thioredoxin [Sediminicola sp.]|jgi:thiol-disulfide isomerase/thioredoxin